MKKYISFGVIIFSTLGAWLGSLLDHGNSFGGWSIILSTIGGFAGIWVGYKIGQYFN